VKAFASKNGSSVTTKAADDSG